MVFYDNNLLFSKFTIQKIDVGSRIPLQWHLNDQTHLRKS
jgi:hypothetical protein